MAPRKPARAGEPKLPPLWDRLQSQIYWYDGLQDLQNLDRGACDLLPVFAEYGHLPGFEASPAFLVGAAAGAIVLLEGLQDRLWVLMDYGDVVVHVFQQDQREFYDLERLWSDVPRVDWSESAA